MLFVAMSFDGYKEFVDEGDTVVVFLSVHCMYSFVVKKDDVFQTKYGALKHSELVGKAYGSVVDCSKGWAYVLHPTPELWTLTLPHRTQILYSTDIGVIILQLELKPGSVVCEAGTGSGSLSHAIVRTIKPTGHLFTFDFHEERTVRCRDEFQVHGIDRFVTVKQRDVVSDGFGLDNVADAVFLDLPLPWEVIASAKQALRVEDEDILDGPSEWVSENDLANQVNGAIINGGRICSFSPCIEQVQKTCQVLGQCGFSDVVTMECLQRPLEVRPVTMPRVQLDSKATTALLAKTDDEDIVEGGAAADAMLRGKRPRKKHYPSASETVTVVEALPPLQTVGHTGYLTVATLCPRLPADVSAK